MSPPSFGGLAAMRYYVGRRRITEPSTEQMADAYRYELEHGTGGTAEKQKKVANHLRERPEYYQELRQMLEPDRLVVLRTVAPEQAAFDQRIDPERPLRCGLCAHYGGGRELVGRCARLAVGAQPLTVHFFQYCGEFVPSALEKAGGWETGPRGGVRRRVGSRWVYRGSGGGSGEESAEGPTKSTADMADDELLEHVTQQDTQAVEHRARAAVNEVAKKDPAASNRAARAAGRMLGAKESGNRNSLLAAFKAFLREYQQAAAPQSVLGPELGGLLADDRKRKVDAEAKRAVATVAKEQPVAKASGPVALVVPIGGSAPREETPAIPDYQDLYFQPRDDQDSKREAEQQANRRRADRTKSGRFSFHGLVPTTQPEPELRFDPDDNVTGEVLGKEAVIANRKPIVEAKDFDDRIQAGSKGAEAEDDEDEDEADEKRRRKRIG